MTADYDPVALLLDIYGGTDGFREAQSGLDPVRWKAAEEERLAGADTANDPEAQETT